MESDPCELERQATMYAFEEWKALEQEYAEEEGDLEYLKAAERTLKNDFVNLGCDVIAVIKHSITIGLLCIAITIAGMEATSARERQEEHLKKLKEKLDGAKQQYENLKKIWMKCKNGLLTCTNCGEKFREDDMTTCGGCGEKYCNLCFDRRIEAWEKRNQQA